MGIFCLRFVGRNCLQGDMGLMSSSWSNNQCMSKGESIRRKKKKKEGGAGVMTTSQPMMSSEGKVMLLYWWPLLKTSQEKHCLQLMTACKECAWMRVHMTQSMWVSSKLRWAFQGMTFNLSQQADPYTFTSSYSVTTENRFLFQLRPGDLIIHYIMLCDKSLITR